MVVVPEQPMQICRVVLDGLLSQTIISSKYLLSFLALLRDECSVVVGVVRSATRMERKWRVTLDGNKRRVVLLMGGKRVNNARVPAHRGNEAIAVSRTRDVDVGMLWDGRNGWRRLAVGGWRC